MIWIQPITSLSVCNKQPQKSPVLVSQEIPQVSFYLANVSLYLPSLNSHILQGKRKVWKRKEICGTLSCSYKSTMLTGGMIPKQTEHCHNLVTSMTKWFLYLYCRDCHNTRNFTEYFLLLFVRLWRGGKNPNIKSYCFAWSTLSSLFLEVIELGLSLRFYLKIQFICSVVVWVLLGEKTI